MTQSIESYRKALAVRNDIYKFRIAELNALKFIPGLVSVITVSFNAATTITRTIESIAAQDYTPLEHIVIDGASNDGTQNLLRNRYKDLAFWISEPDEGISDAFNKGIAIARGEFIALVNSDDWLEPTHISNAIESLRTSHADFVFGNLVFHDADGRIAYVIHGDSDYSSKLRHSMPELNHPTIVCRRAVYETAGLYDVTLRVAMDYEWAVRGLRHGVLGIHSSLMTGHMSMTGVSHKDFLLGFREVRHVSIANGYPRVFAYLRYALRVIRVTARITIQRVIPQKYVDRLRQWLNPQFKGSVKK